MTRYRLPLEDQFGALIGDLKKRLSVLEQRTNAIGTNSNGSVTVSNLFVVNASGQVRVVPESALPFVTDISPSIELDSGQGSSTVPFLLYSHLVTDEPSSPFEEGVIRGPQSAADSAGSAAVIYMSGGGTGANVASGVLQWEQNNGPVANDTVLWDQWGLTLTQPYSGSLASAGATVKGSALQNDQPPGSGELPKFFHPSGYSGTTNASGELTFNHGCTFTPQGMGIWVNASGVGANLMVGIEANRFTSTQATFWVKVADTGALYASSFLTFYALLWG